MITPTIDQPPRPQTAPAERQLPADLVATLRRLAANAPAPDTADAWHAYGQAKRVISAAVGWDSDQCDCRLYDAAVSLYVEAAGL